MTFMHQMFSIYKTTAQGKQTRSILLNHICPGEELTREDFMQRSQLTYDQVRRQTRNLVIEGKLRSRVECNVYYYRLH